MKRINSDNILHLGNRLFQQYCVDQYAKVKSCRLRFIRNSREKLRAELYNGLADAVEAGDADRTGRRYIFLKCFQMSSIA